MTKGMGKWRPFLGVLKDPNRWRLSEKFSCFSFISSLFIAYALILSSSQCYALPHERHGGTLKFPAQPVNKILHMKSTPSLAISAISSARAAASKASSTRPAFISMSASSISSSKDALPFSEEEKKGINELLREGISPGAKLLNAINSKNEVLQRQKSEALREVARDCQYNSDGSDNCKDKINEMANKFKLLEPPTIRKFTLRKGENNDKDQRNRSEDGGSKNKDGGDKNDGSNKNNDARNEKKDGSNKKEDEGGSKDDKDRNKGDGSNNSEDRNSNDGNKKKDEGSSHIMISDGQDEIGDMSSSGNSTPEQPDENLMFKIHMQRSRANNSERRINEHQTGISELQKALSNGSSKSGLARSVVVHSGESEDNLNEKEIKRLIHSFHDDGQTIDKELQKLQKMAHLNNEKDREASMLSLSSTRSSSLSNLKDRPSRSVSRATQRLTYPSFSYGSPSSLSLSPVAQSSSWDSRVPTAVSSVVAISHAQVQGILDIVNNLFGNGMTDKNPANWEGGNMGSFFNFMYPLDTDYPWACLCDESKFKEYQSGTVNSVPCRNQVDQSLQGVQALCNPANHLMNSNSFSPYSSSMFVAAIALLLYSLTS